MCASDSIRPNYFWRRRDRRRSGAADESRSVVRGASALTATLRHRTYYPTATYIQYIVYYTAVVTPTTTTTNTCQTTAPTSSSIFQFFMSTSIPFFLGPHSTCSTNLFRNIRNYGLTIKIQLVLIIRFLVCGIRKLLQQVFV